MWSLIVKMFLLPNWGCLDQVLPFSLVGKERSQYGNQDLQDHIVGLTFQGAILGPGECIGECLRAITHLRVAV